MDREVDPAHGMHLARARTAKRDTEVTDLEQWSDRCRSTLGPDVERVAQAVAEEVERHHDVRMAIPGATAIHHW